MTTQHTPTPKYRLETHEQNGTKWAAVYCNEKFVGNIQFHCHKTGEAEDARAFIVRACNAHQELLAAAKLGSAAMQRILNIVDYPETSPVNRDKATVDAAIAKVEGK